MRYPASIQNLIDHFSKLPTVGPKTAERYVFYLLKTHPEWLQGFAQAIAELKEKTTVCQTCLSLAETNPCSICSDPKRNRSIVCLVAETRDLLAIESTKQYNGLYHVLGGVINTIEDIKPESLNFKQLINRLKQNTIYPVKKVSSAKDFKSPTATSLSNPSTPSENFSNGIKEIILAFNPDLEGETTSMYIVKLLKPYKIKITRLAKGLPMGADLEYADEITLSNALKYRNEM